MSKFFCKCGSKNLVQGKICFKNADNPSYLDLFITNGLSDFHRMIMNVLKSNFSQVKPKEIIYRNLKNFDLKSFKNDIRTKIQSVDNYDAFEKEFLNPFSSNPTKRSNTLKQFVGKLPTNCLSVFGHFVKLALKGLKY